MKNQSDKENYSTTTSKEDDVFSSQHIFLNLLDYTKQGSISRKGSVKATLKEISNHKPKLSQGQQNSESAQQPVQVGSPASRSQLSGTRTLQLASSVSNPQHPQGVDRAGGARAQASNDSNSLASTQ